MSAAQFDKEILICDDIIEEIDVGKWVSSLVIVEKADGRLRISLDPFDLNKAIKREHYPMLTAETV